MKKGPNVSLILPCYNEAEHFTDSIQQILTILTSVHFSWEIILIDDKSSDGTKKLLQQFKQQTKRKNISVYFHNKNQGRGATVIDGIRKSQGDIVGFIDIDLEVSPKYIPQFVAEIEKGFQVVCAYRQYKLSLFAIPRWIVSTTYRRLLRILFRHALNDTEAGYKFFDKKSIKPVLKKATDNHWFWDTEIMIYSYYTGLKIKEIVIPFNRRKDKTSTVRLLPDTVDYLIKVVRLFYKLHLSKEI